MAEQLGEPFDARVPQLFVAAEPFVGSRERSRVDAAVVDAPSNRAFYQSGTLERRDVLRGGGERHPVGRRQLAHSALSAGKPLQHRAPCPVAERAEDEVETGLIMFNHIVEYIPSGFIVNHLVDLLHGNLPVGDRGPFRCRIDARSSRGALQMVRMALSLRDVCSATSRRRSPL